MAVDIDMEKMPKRIKTRANWLHKKYFNAHRGVLGPIQEWRGELSYDNCYVIFGNDGYAPKSGVIYTPKDPALEKLIDKTPDTRARQVVTILRKAFISRDIIELEFSTDDSGYTWAMLVSANNDKDYSDEISELQWNAWFEASKEHEVKKDLLAWEAE